MQNTSSRLSALMEKQIQKKIEGVELSTTLEDTGVDSFDFIELLFLIEDEFGIEINESANDLGTKLKTVGDLVAYIENLLPKPSFSVNASAAV